MPVIGPGLTHLKGVLARLVPEVTHIRRGRGRGLVFLALSIQNMFATCASASQYGGSVVGEEYKRSRFL